MKVFFFLKLITLIFICKTSYPLPLGWSIGHSLNKKKCRKPFLSYHILLLVLRLWLTLWLIRYVLSFVTKYKITISASIHPEFYRNVHFATCLSLHTYNVHSTAAAKIHSVAYTLILKLLQPRKVFYEWTYLHDFV